MIQELLTKMNSDQLKQVEQYCNMVLNAKPIDEIEKKCPNCKYFHTDSPCYPCNVCDINLNQFTPNT